MNPANIYIRAIRGSRAPQQFYMQIYRSKKSLSVTYSLAHARAVVTGEKTRLYHIHARGLQYRKSETEEEK